MIKRFSELQKGDRVLLVYPDGHTRSTVCLTPPVLLPNGQALAQFRSMFLSDDSFGVFRDRNFQIPVISQEVKP